MRNVASASPSAGIGRRVPLTAQHLGQDWHVGQALQAHVGEALAAITARVVRHRLGAHLPRNQVAVAVPQANQARHAAWWEGAEGQGRQGGPQAGGGGGRGLGKGGRGTACRCHRGCRIWPAVLQPGARPPSGLWLHPRAVRDQPTHGPHSDATNLKRHVKAQRAPATASARRRWAVPTAGPPAALCGRPARSLLKLLRCRKTGSAR